MVSLWYTLTFPLTCSFSCSFCFSVALSCAPVGPRKNCLGSTATNVCLHDVEDTTMILEEDAVLMKDSPSVESIVKELDQLDRSWNVLQLGRCWDICSRDKTLLTFGNFSFVKSLTPCCTHAYIIKKSAANILLHYGIPHVTSVDLLIGLLQRQRIINLYSITPPIFTQKRSKLSHDTTKLMECDPNEVLLNYPQKDAETLSVLNDKRFTLPVI